MWLYNVFILTKISFNSAEDIWFHIMFTVVTSQFIDSRQSQNIQYIEARIKLPRYANEHSLTHLFIMQSH